MKISKIHLKSILVKFVIFFSALIFFLFVLEMAIRVSGILWQNNRVTIPLKNKISNENKNLFCFGDSYTVGGLGRRETSYPSLLSNKCSKDGINVYNLGICESNSTQVLENLKNNVIKKSPDIIVLLTGAANKYNFYGMKKINFYQKFRIYKMCHIMYLSLKNRFIKKNISKYPISGYYFIPNINKILSDAKQINDVAGTIQTIHSVISKNNNFIPRNVFLRKNKKIVQDLLDTISYEEKQKIPLDLINIYLYLENYKDFNYYYEIAKKNNAKRAKKILADSLTSYYGNVLDEDFVLNLFNNEIVEDNPKEGYFLIIQHNLNGLFFCKDEERKTKRLNIVKDFFEKLKSLDEDSLQLKELLFQFYKETGDFDNAQKLLDKIMKDLDSMQLYKYYLEMAYYSVYYTRFDKAVYYFLEAFKISPSIDMHCYYYFSKSFELQSKYDSNYIAEQLETILKNNSNLKNNYSFISTLESFKNKIDFENKILEWLQFDIEQIIQICKTKKIKLFIQNYPFPYLSINEKLKEIAMDNKISFIDNYSIFCELVEKEGYSKYFLDFDHCTELGHETIAENVYSALKQEGFVNGK